VRCLSCWHAAHAGRRCGVGTYFTGTCGCRMPLWSEEEQRLAERAARREPWTQEELARMPSSMVVRGATDGTPYSGESE